MEVLENINTWFWNEYVWLPKNITWKILADTSVYNYSQFDDIYYAFPVSVVLLVIRCILEKFLFTPIGCYLGLKSNVQREPDNQLLEKAFCENAKIGHKQIQGLAKQLDWSERKVERWIRKRIAQSRPSTLKKFKESAWRFTFYSCSFSYGLYILWDKPWFTETEHCFYNFPHHSLTNDVWWYYMLELGFYWSLCCSQFLETKRKDFIEMFVHHIITIMLLSISWTCNMFRLGTLVLIIHDCADIPMEGSKLAKYVGHQRLADAFFIVFTVTWTVTRLWLYPYRILYYSLYKGLDFTDWFPVYLLINVLLSGLLVLHILWTYTICNIAIRTIFLQNPGFTDLRSESDVSTDSTSERETKENSSHWKNSHEPPLAFQKNSSASPSLQNVRTNNSPKLRLFKS